MLSGYKPAVCVELPTIYEPLLDSVIVINIVTILSKFQPSNVFMYQLQYLGYKTN